MPTHPQLLTGAPIPKSESSGAPPLYLGSLTLDHWTSITFLYKHMEAEEVIEGTAPV